MLFGMIAALSCIVTACKTSEQEIIWPEQEEIPLEQESGQLGQELTQPEAEENISDALDGQILEGISDYWKQDEDSFEETSESLTEEEKLLVERMEYYRKSAYYPEIIDYWENVREVRDVSNRIMPLYESDVRYLTKEDLAFDPPVVIHLAKNEIYARHGYIFKDQNLYNYFMGCIWYTPTIAPEDFGDEVFNEYEKENLKLLDELDTM